MAVGAKRHFQPHDLYCKAIWILLTLVAFRLIKTFTRGLGNESTHNFYCTNEKIMSRHCQCVKWYHALFRLPMSLLTRNWSKERSH